MTCISCLKILHNPVFRIVYTTHIYYLKYGIALWAETYKFSIGRIILALWTVLLQLEEAYL